MNANELSPEFTSPLIFAGFAMINGWRDYEAADSVARIVDATKGGLPRYDRLRLELLQATLEGDHLKAYLAVREAAEISPGGSAHYTAGDKALDLNRPREGLEILSTWDPTRTAVRLWTPYWKSVTEAHHMLGDHDAELREARLGRSQIPGRLETLWYEARALAALGRTSEVMGLLEESLQLRSNPRMNPGLLMFWAAEELKTHGYPEAADSVLIRLEAWLGSQDAEQRAGRDLGVLEAQGLYLQGRLQQASEPFLDLLDEERPDPVFLRYLGAIAARSGDRNTAMEFLDALASLDQPYLFGTHTLGRAVITAYLGEKEEAFALLQTSMTLGVAYGTALLADSDLAVLVDYPPFVSFLEPEG